MREGNPKRSPRQPNSWSVGRQAESNRMDISPRTAGYVSADLLARGIPYLLFEKFGQGKPVPMNSTKSIIFRRYEALDTTPSALSAGVTPTAKESTTTC